MVVTHALLTALVFVCVQMQSSSLGTSGASHWYRQLTSDPIQPSPPPALIAPHVDVSPTAARNSDHYGNLSNASAAGSVKSCTRPSVIGETSDVTYTSISAAATKILRDAESFSVEHRCPVCPYTNAVQSRLMRHINMHQGEKPFACQFCHFRTNQQGNLRTHERTHTGERPFPCLLCDYRATQKNRLKTHMMSIHRLDT